MTDEETICPSCEERGGAVGAPCPQPICERKGYHCIPLASYLRYKKWAAQPGAGEDREIGRMVDRYLVVEKLGQGGMGSVYLALQMPLQREVALKMVSGVVLDEVSRQRFEREAKAISILYHPNIVSLIDYGFNPDTGAPFMAIEYVKGGKELALEIGRKKNRREAWDYEVLKNIFSQILNGLSIAHKSGLIHRDIKPQNIMLLEIEGNLHFVKILDFGLARALVEIPGASKLTLQGTIMGTPQYMAPEQIYGKGSVDHRCDLYAVGAMFFEMVTSTSIYPGESPREIFSQKMNPDFDPMSAVPPGSLHSEIEFFLRKSLSRDPAGRFLTAAEMKEHLVRALTAAGASKEGGREDIGYAPTIEMELPPGFDPDAMTEAEQATHMRAAETPANGSTRDTESIELPEDELIAKKRASPAVLLLLAGILAAAALVVFFVILPAFQETPRAAEGDAGEETGVEEKAAAERAEEQESEEEIIELSAIPPGMDRKTARKAKKGGRKPEAAEDDAAGGTPGPDAATAGDAATVDAAAASDAPILPQLPAQSDVKKARRRLRKKVEKCVEDHDGKVLLRLTLSFHGPSGKVRDIRFKTKVLPEESTACVEEAAAWTTLPPFGEETYEMEFFFQKEKKTAGAEDSGEEKEGGEEEGQEEERPGEEGGETDEKPPEIKITSADLSDKDINSALRKGKIQAKLRSCAGEKTGSVTLLVVVEGHSGKVKAAKVTGGDFKDSAEAACMENALKKLVFSQILKVETRFERTFAIK